MRKLLPALCLVSGLNAQTTTALRQLSDGIVELSDRVRPSVVQVITNGYAPEGDAAAIRQSTGSGFVVSPDGLIVTNAHVVSGSTRVQVYLPAGRVTGRSIVKPRGPLVKAKVLGTDSETDLALLKVEAQHLPALSFGDSDRVRQGQMVFAFGHPLGLEEAVSMGVISAVARQLKPDDPVIYIQTDAPINPGNSGGPLVDLDGRVIGINTMILSQSGGSEGVGFAVPGNIAKNITDQLRSKGRVSRSYIGAEAQTITPGMAAGLGLDRETGVILADVLPGSPADAGGLQAGDIVLALNGRVMENARQFQVSLYRQPTLSEVSVTVLRQGSERIQKVQVLEIPGDPDRLARVVEGKLSNVPRLGILAVALDDPIREFLKGLRHDKGVLVASRAVSATEASGLLQPGDVIYSFDRQAVATLAELNKLLEAKESGELAVLHVERGGVLRYLEVPLD